MGSQRVQLSYGTVGTDYSVFRLRLVCRHPLVILADIAQLMENYTAIQAIQGPSAAEFIYTGEGNGLSIPGWRWPILGKLQENPDTCLVIWQDVRFP